MIGVQYKDGSSYKGSLNENGLKNGSGTFQTVEGTKYSGQFNNGQCDGVAIYEFPNGRFCGSFSNNRFNGYGVLEIDGLKYEGQFLNGQFHGLGRITFKDKTNGLPRYEGYFENGKITRHEQCQQAIQEAHIAAEKARNNKL